MAARLSLTVIVTTIEPWPDLSHVLDVLHPQVTAFGGEIIVAASDLAAPEELVVVDTPRVRWLRRRDATIPSLRAMATELARGEIIATTEDDCLVADDWCAEVIRGFAIHPLARAITGLTRDADGGLSDDSGHRRHELGGRVRRHDRRWATRVSSTPTSPISDRSFLRSRSRPDGSSVTSIRA